MGETRSGRCVCGGVRFAYEFSPTFVAVCHCLDCKDASGEDAATFFAVPEEKFTVLSGSPKPVRYVAESGKALERLFCADCGTQVYTANLESFPGSVFVALACVDNPMGIEPKIEMFTKRRVQSAKALDLPQFPGMPS